MTRVDVVGAGPVGTCLGVDLAAAGHDVRLVARARRLDELQDGAVVADVRTGARTTTALDVATAPRGDAELVVVAVGAHQLPEAVRLVDEGRAPVLLLGNGTRDMTGGLEASRAVLGFPGPGGTLRDGVVARFDELDGERFPTTLDGAHPASPRVAALLREAGLPVEEEPDMEAWRRTHLAVAVPIAGALALCGGSAERVRDTPDARLVLAAAVKDALLAVRRLGHAPTPARHARLGRLPVPALAAATRRLFGSELARERFEAHLRHAPGEHAHLASELRWLLDEAGLAAPAARLLCDRLGRDRDAPTLLVGSRDLRSGRGAPLAAAAVVAAGALARRRRGGS